jgi:hypothetical protein
MKVLLCGDGDFSFSLSVARILSLNVDETSESKVVATSYEPKETLAEVYPNFVETLQELEDRGYIALQC